MSAREAGPLAPEATPPEEPGIILCPGCGYDLRGSPGERCPECGLEIDRTALGESRIPWSHRGKLGRWRAYWRTLRLAGRYPGRLAREVARPVSFDDAARFRRVTVLLAFVPTAAVVLYLYVLSLEVSVTSGAGPWGVWFSFGETQSRRALLRGGQAAGWLLEWAVLLALLAGVWLLLLSSSAVAGYFFHPRRLSPVQQNRAVALSYYACAPLGLTPLTMALVGGATFLFSRSTGDPLAWVQVAGSMVVAAQVIALIQLLLWYVGTLVLLKRTTHCGAGRVAAAAVVLPLLWILLGVLTLAALPAAAALVAAVILSLL